MLDRIGKLLRRDRREPDDLLYDEPESLVRVAIRCCSLPFEILLRPLEYIVLKLVRPREDDALDYDGRPRLDKLQQLLGCPEKSLRRKFCGWLQVVCRPWDILQHVVRYRKRELLFSLPPASVLTFFAFVLYQVVVNADAIERTYRRGAQAAWEAGDFSLARTYFARIAGAKARNRADRLQWAVILARSGQPQRAGEILAELAPDDARGYAPAHRVLALSLLSQLNRSPQAGLLRRLRWHLDRGNDNTLPMLKAWAAYYLALEDFDRAVDYLQQAAVTNPELLLPIADIFRSTGRSQSMQATLQAARSRFEEQLARDPLDSVSRTRLASVLIRLEEFDSAEDVLLTGYRLQPDSEIQHALSDYYIVRYDLASGAATSLPLQLELLNKALKANPHNQVVFERLETLYDSAGSDRDAASVKAAVMEAVTSGQSTAFSHLALSHFLWDAQKFAEAEWHVEQAFRLEPNLVNAINNWAWILAHREPPELHRALELARSALDRLPNDPRVLDTYATVLQFQGEYAAAIPYYNQALPASSLSGELHRKLAICYRELGRDDLAELHEQKSRQSKQLAP